jgi:hypothetical protein
MQENVFMQVLWLACGLTTIIAGVLASRSRRARYLGRAAVGVLLLVGGALVHVSNLATGADDAGFADPAHFGWVTDAWRAVVAPNQVLFISLLVVLEATVGALLLSGRRRTQLDQVGVLGIYLALWLFGWFETVWVVSMLPPISGRPPMSRTSQWRTSARRVRCADLSRCAAARLAMSDRSRNVRETDQGYHSTVVRAGWAADAGQVNTHRR